MHSKWHIASWLWWNRAICTFQKGSDAKDYRNFLWVITDQHLKSQETSVKDYQNFNFRQPYSQASYYVSLILEDKRWPVAEKLEALSKLESDSFAKFVPHLLSKTFLECYVQGLAFVSIIVFIYLCVSWVENISNCTFTILLVGNIEPSEAKSVVEEIENTIFNAPNSLFKSMSPSEYLTKRIVMLENELKCYYQTEGLNQKNENSSVIQYIQV